MESAASDYGIGNPIVQLRGHPPFVVHVPPDDTSPAILRIGRLATDALAFQTFHLSSYNEGVPLPGGIPVWNDFGIPSCIQQPSAGLDYCVTSLWDTGAPDSYVAWTDQPAPLTTELSVGSTVSVTIGPPNAPLGAYQLVVGASPTLGVDEIFIEPVTGAPYINLGMALFRHYDALFDQADGLVGLAQH
jgi:hypothetical protein